MTQNVSGWLPNLIGPVALADEGVAVPARPTINFTGAGVTATDNPGQNRTDITIPGGGGGASLPNTVPAKVTKTTNYTIVASTDYLVIASTAGITITLPASPADGVTFVIANTSTGTVTIGGNLHNLSATGSASMTLATTQSATCTWDLASTTWIVT